MPLRIFTNTIVLTLLAAGTDHALRVLSSHLSLLCNLRPLRTSLGQDKIGGGSDATIRHVRPMVKADCKFPAANTVLGVADRFNFIT